MSRDSEVPTYQTTHHDAPVRRRQERGSVGNARRYCAGGTASLLATTSGGNGLPGERHVNDTGRPPVHSFVHPVVSTSLHHHRSSVRNDDVLARRQNTELGWSNPACTVTELVAVAPALYRGGNEAMPRPENESGEKTGRPIWHPVTKVILKLHTSVFTDFRTLQSQAKPPATKPTKFACALS